MELTEDNSNVVKAIYIDNPMKLTSDVNGDSEMYDIASMDWWHYESGTKVNIEALNALETEKDDPPKVSQKEKERINAEFNTWREANIRVNDMDETEAFMVFMWGGDLSDEDEDK